LLNFNLKGNRLYDQGCIVLNEIFKDSKIEEIDLSSTFYLKSGNGITNTGLENMKESLINNEYLKIIKFSGKNI
jgi:hypothetical protein